MSESIQARWQQLKELELSLQDAIRAIAQREHQRQPGIVPSFLAEPTWELIKKNIHPELMIWQIAYLFYPLTDPIKTKNPRVISSFFCKRLYFMYQLIELVGNGRLSDYELPPTIPSKRHLKSATIEDKVQICIHIERLAESFRCGDLSSVISPVIRVWNAYIQKAKKPSLIFIPCPDVVHVVGNYPKNSYFVCMSGPFEYQEGDYLSLNLEGTRFVDSFMYWRENHYSLGHKLNEDLAGYLNENLNLSRRVKVSKDGECGEPPEWEMSLEEYEAISQSKAGRTDNSKKYKTVVKKNPEWEQLVREMYKTNPALSHTGICIRLSTTLGENSETIRRKTTNPKPRNKQK